MDNLTKTQFIFLVLLVSFITSLVTGIVTVTLVNQAPPPMTQTINKVIEKTIGIAAPGPALVERVMISQEDLVVELVKNVSPAVLSIVATRDLPVIEQYFINPFEEDEFFSQLFPPGSLPDFQIPQYRQKGTEKRQISSGTGFLVSKDGLILTNRHVVEDSKAEYSVIMNDGRKLEARVLARDLFQDLAILKIEGSDFNYIPLGDSNNLKVGQTVIAIGNALGEFQNTVSVGVISGLNRTVIASGSATGPEKLQELIQSDAAINLGNSGGPLINLEARVIGINTAIAQSAENIGFALPINAAKKDLADVKAFGKISFAFLGIKYLIITPQIREEKKLSVDYGALIIPDPNDKQAIFPNSPAEKIGLKQGDIILEFDGVKIDINNTLAKLIIKKRVGDKVSLKVLRDGKEMMMEVELGELPQT